MDVRGRARLLAWGCTHGYERCLHLGVRSPRVCLRLGYASQRVATCSVVCCVSCLACCLQFAARFAQLDFHDVSSVTIDVRRDTPPATIPTHILNALTLLAPLCSPNTELTLADLDVNATLAAQLPAIAAAAAGWRRLSLTGLVWPETTAGVATVLPPLYKCGLSADLTDALLAQLAQWAPSVTELSVNKATLTVVPERMPCQRLNVLRLAVWELVQQAGVVGEGVEWHLQRLTVYLTPEQVCASSTPHAHAERSMQFRQDTYREAK